MCVSILYAVVILELVKFVAMHHLTHYKDCVQCVIKM